MESAVIETVAGYVSLCWTENGLAALKLPVPTIYEAEMEIQPDLEIQPGGSNPGKKAANGKIDIKLLEKELHAYFSGKPVEFSFPVDWGCYTDFQKRVLQRVCSIPWGQVVSYGQIAAGMGNPRAARAVGGAVGSNRVLLVVPCHRVIAHDGTLGGFGGGVGWKRKLLQMEGVAIK
jgi:methylated-DNA-[protein]-cysteine S-methyltransferase